MVRYSLRFQTPTGGLRTYPSRKRWAPVCKTWSGSPCLTVSRCKVYFFLVWAAFSRLMLFSCIFCKIWKKESFISKRKIKASCIFAHSTLAEFFYWFMLRKSWRYSWIWKCLCILLCKNNTEMCMWVGEVLQCDCSSWKDLIADHLYHQACVFPTLHVFWLL